MFEHSIQAPAFFSLQITHGRFQRYLGILQIKQKYDVGCSRLGNLETRPVHQK